MRFLTAKDKLANRGYIGKCFRPLTGIKVLNALIDKDMINRSRFRPLAGIMVLNLMRRIIVYQIVTSSLRPPSGIRVLNGNNGKLV